MLKRKTLRTNFNKVVCSFMQREGRMSLTLREVLKNHWVKYSVELSPLEIDFVSCFGTSLPIVIEIGFGNGDSLFEMAKNNPHINFIGIEVYLTGIAKLLHKIVEHNLTNIKIMHADAVEVLTHMVPDSSIERIQLFFPDPWQKRKHKKRRIVKDDFIQLMHKKLSANGLFHFATDWKDYAVDVSETFANDIPAKLFALDLTSDLIISRPKTKFEERGINLGHHVTDLVFKKIFN